MILHSELKVSAEGQIHMEKRAERLNVGRDAVPAELMAIVEESGALAIEQKVTNQLHSGFGRTIGDHFISCYLCLKEWGNPEPVNIAGLLHAAYQRGDGMQAVKASEVRPEWQEKLGAEAEDLIYLFPSAHKSVLAP